MNDKQIQTLVDRYLDGLTTPEEEMALATALSQRGELKAEWQTVSLMLGELTAGEAEYDRIVAERQQTKTLIHPATRKSRRWMWAAGLSVAASLLLAIVLTWPKEAANPLPSPAQTIAEAQPPIQTHPEEAGTIAKNQEQPVQQPQQPALQHQRPIQRRRRHVPQHEVQMAQAMDELPDTLGEGIWKSEENVRRALEVLSECQRDIAACEQQTRNEIIEATYTAMPQQQGSMLVMNEDGDYFIVNDTGQLSCVKL